MARRIKIDGERFGRDIRAARVGLCFVQSDLAKVIKCNERQIVRVENGEISTAGGNVFRQLCDVLGLKAEDYILKNENA